MEDDQTKIIDFRKRKVINPDQTIPLDSKMTKFTGLTNIST